MTKPRQFEPKSAILIAGPTASGKSALALAKAHETGGFIINADSMQVYDILRVITARPGPEELAGAEHHLYGHVHPSVDYSVGRWTADVETLLARDDLQGRMPIFVGGTGLYFRSLLGGLSQMPDVPDEIRQQWRVRLAAEGPEALHPLLLEKDPVAGARIKPRDGQRIIRALEIHDASGKPITFWQGRGSPPLVSFDSSEKIRILPDREELDRRIVARLKLMVEQGALAEVATLGKLDLNPLLPAMKAIGVPELLDHWRARTTLDEALRLAALSTRQYAKRQFTWFRNQLDEHWTTITP